MIAVMMGVPGLVSLQIFIEPTLPGACLGWSFSVFWALRLFV